MTVTSAPAGVRALLADGRVVRIRILWSSDVDVVLQLHQRMSEHDTYLRFFGIAREFLHTVAERITPRPDAKHAALGAYLDDVLVGVAHYETLADPHVAEIALVVEGDVKAYGLGHSAAGVSCVGGSPSRGAPVRGGGAGREPPDDRGDRRCRARYRTHFDGPESEHAVLRKLANGGYAGTLSAVNPHAERPPAQLDSAGAATSSTNPIIDSPRNSNDDLLYERDRVTQRTLPQGDPRTRSFPHGAGSDEVSVSCDPQPGPHWHRPHPMDDALEASHQRIRHHIR
jgi:hypothetical protein